MVSTLCTKLQEAISMCLICQKLQIDRLKETKYVVPPKNVGHIHSAFKISSKGDNLESLN